MEKARTGFTKTGFTKAGFGCCGRFAYCEMGKKECFYAILDPEVQEYCAAFQRVKNEPVPPIINNGVPLLAVSSIESAKAENAIVFTEEEKGQLSLF